VLVGPEGYSEQVVCTNAHSGTASARNTFTSQTLHAATIFNTADGVLRISCDYTTWTGFSVQGSTDTSGVQVWLEGNLQGNGNEAHNVIISRFEVIGGACTGIFLERAGNLTQESQAARDNVVERSTIHDNGDETCTEQAHGIYVQGYRNVIVNNLVYDQWCGSGIHEFNDSWDVQILYNTVSHNGHGNWGDECYNGGTACNFCGSGIVMDDSSGRPISGGITVGNIVYDNRQDGIYFGNGAWYGSCTTISYNLSYSNDSDQYDTTNVPDCFSRPPGTECGFAWNGSGTNRCADPLFTNYASRIFTLQSTSPAINTGESTYDPPDDYAGLARPSGSTSDKGAYEYDLSGGPG
jgi:hypothetical protein